MMQPEKNSYLWMGNTPVCKIDFNEKDSKEEIKKKIELGVWARCEIEKAKREAEESREIREMEQRRIDLEKELERKEKRLRKIKLKTKEEGEKLEREIEERENIREQRDKELEKIEAFKDDKTKFVEREKRKEEKKLKKLREKREKEKKKVGVLEDEKKTLREKLEELNRKVDMATSLKNVVDFPGGMTANQRRYKKWREKNYEKNPTTPGQTKIRQGEYILYAVSMGYGGFISLSCDENDRFSLWFDWHGKRFNLPQNSLKRMLEFRESCNPSSVSPRLSRFKDKKEIKWMRKYFRGQLQDEGLDPDREVKIGGERENEEED